MIDSEENTLLFEDAMKHIIEEFGQGQKRVSIAITSVTTVGTGDFWTTDEENFVCALSNLMAISIEMHKQVSWQE